MPTSTIVPGVANLIGGFTGEISPEDMIQNIVDMQAQNAKIKAMNAKVSAELMRHKLNQQREARLDRESRARMGLAQSAESRAQAGEERAVEKRTLDKEDRLRGIEQEKTKESRAGVRFSQELIDNLQRSLTESETKISKKKGEQRKAKRFEWEKEDRKLTLEQFEAKKEVARQDALNRQIAGRLIEEDMAKGVPGAVEQYKRFLLKEKLQAQNKPMDYLSSRRDVDPELDSMLGVAGVKGFANLPIANQAWIQERVAIPLMEVGEHSKVLMLEANTIRKPYLNKFAEGGFPKEVASKIYDETVARFIANPEAVQYSIKSGGFDTVIQKAVEDLSIIFKGGLGGPERTISGMVSEILIGIEENSGMDLRSWYTKLGLENKKAIQKDYEKSFSGDALDIDAFGKELSKLK